MKDVPVGSRGPAGFPFLKQLMRAIDLYTTLLFLGELLHHAESYWWFRVSLWMRPKYRRGRSVSMMGQLVSATYEQYPTCLFLQ